MSSLADALAHARAQGDLKPLVAAIPYFRFLGLEAELRDGQVLARLPFKDTLIGNPMLPALHGGVTSAFLEAAAVLQVLMSIETVKVPRTINITVDYLRPGRAQTVFAAARILRAGQRVANLSVECWQERDDMPIAAARCNFMIADSAS
jgi:uncharacterized protein (TIGR00369 family)